MHFWADRQYDTSIVRTNCAFCQVCDHAFTPTVSIHQEMSMSKSILIPVLDESVQGHRRLQMVKQQRPVNDVWTTKSFSHSPVSQVQRATTVWVLKASPALILPVRGFHVIAYKDQFSRNFQDFRESGRSHLFVEDPHGLGQARPILESSKSHDLYGRLGGD